MTRSPSPVGLVRAAMAADFSADVAAAAGRLVVEAAAAQQVRCSQPRPVVAKQLALSLESDNDKSWLVLRLPSKSSDLITKTKKKDFINDIKHRKLGTSSFRQEGPMR